MSDPKRMTDTQASTYAALTAAHNAAVIADIKAKIAELDALAGELRIGSLEDATARDQIREVKRTFDLQWAQKVAPLITPSEGVSS